MREVVTECECLDARPWIHADPVPPGEFDPGPMVTTVDRDTWTRRDYLPAVGLCMTTSVKPDPGELAATIGRVEIVRRVPPESGGNWWAVYAANCADHGWLVSRATVAELEAYAAGHMAEAHAENCPEA